MGFFIFRCQRSAFYANERMRATSDATTPRKGEIQPNFSRFQAFLRVFHRVENEAHSMQINECTDTTTLPERLKKRKNAAKLFPDLKCISPRERVREISKMIRTPWKKKLSNSIRRIIKWITNFLIKVGIKGGIKPDKCALACLVRWSALKYTTNRRGKDLENGPPSIRNLAQVVLLLSIYYSNTFRGKIWDHIQYRSRKKRNIRGTIRNVYRSVLPCNCKHAYRSRLIGIPRIVVRESAPTILRERCQKWRRKTRGRWWQRVEIKSMQFPVGWVHSSRCNTRLLSSGKGLKLALLSLMAS